MTFTGCGVRKFNLNEIVKLHIDPMYSHPALTQSSTSASHRNRRKPTARKDADPADSSGYRCQRRVFV